MANLAELKKQHAAVLGRAEALVAVSDREKRSMTSEESSLFDGLMASVSRSGKDIEAIEAKNTLLTTLRASGGMLLPGNPGAPGAPQRRKSSLPLGNNPMELPVATLSHDYQHAWNEWVSSGGTKMDAALYEGSNVAGGYAVPTLTDGTVVPLAPQEMAVRRIALVVPTTNDLKVPIKATFGTAAIKAESGASETTFTDSDPTLGQFELTSFMVGRQTSASWELLQDVAQFQAFVVDDLILSLQMFEESQFINGTGTGEPQGLIGNTGAGVTGVANTGSALLDATYDVQASLNAAYHAGASFLMARSTGVALRKAQKQANLFEPVFTRSNG
jgi:HK97 family phage major capsid protein